MPSGYNAQQKALQSGAADAENTFLCQISYSSMTVADSEKKIQTPLKQQHKTLLIYTDR